MSRFSYKAVNKAGEHVVGSVEAIDRRGAVANLADIGQFVSELSEETAASHGQQRQSLLELVRSVPLGSRRVSSKDILAMTSQLSAALRAGLALLKALEILRDQQQKPAVREILQGLVDSVSAGQSLSEAMAAYENIFSPLYLSMIRVGETGGILEQTTTQLVSILSRDEKIKANMRNASAYPLFVLGVGIISVIVIVTWVLPRILATISGGIDVLPWPTRLLMGLSSFIKNYGLLVAIAIAAASYYFKIWARSRGRLRWDTIKLGIPVLGSVLRTIAVGRFTRTLGALTKGGVTILESLGVVRDTLGNELLARQIDSVTEKVKGGAPLAEPLQASGYFPPLLVQIVSVGEQTGRLDELLLDAAETFDDEADSAIAKFMAIFPAVLILLLALVIAFIIIAILLPVAMMGLGSGVL